jgi:hypothetical protein
MKGGQPKNRQENPDPANLDYSELSSNQEAKAVPWMAGERAIAVEWVSPIYNQFTKDVPSAGKK